jgi:hypothetical protein
MIGGQAVEQVATMQVKATVSNVSDREHRPDEPGSHHCGAHSAVFSVTPRLLMHGVISQSYGASQAIGRSGKFRTRQTDQWERGIFGGVCEMAGNDLNRAATGHFTRPVTSHAVADDEQADGGIGVKPVFVVMAGEADI